MSVVDDLCEGKYDHLPDDVQEKLRAVANNRFATPEEKRERVVKILGEAALPETTP